VDPDVWTVRRFWNDICGYDFSSQGWMQMSRYLKDLISVSILVQIWISVFIFNLNIDVKWMYPYYGTCTRTRLVVLHVSRAPEAREPPNLFFACVRTRTRVCACGVSCVRPKLYLIKKWMYPYSFLKIIIYPIPHLYLTKMWNIRHYLYPWSINYFETI
jgi:hypothetical protein